MEAGPGPPGETPTERRRRLANERRRRYREAHRDQLRDLSRLRREADDADAERQRSQRRRDEGTHERDQQQRSQRRRDEGTHERDQQQRSQRRRDEGTHADNHLRNRLRSFSVPAQDRRITHPFVAAVTGLKTFKTCNICKETDILADTKVNAGGTCTRCHRERTVPHKFSAANGMIPDAVPDELRSLTFLEEMLISKILPSIYICRLRGGGQYGYSNHAIAFPQELDSLAVELPRRPSETGVLLIRKRGTNNTQRDYRVRQAKVAAALRWLQINNPYYANITISHNNIAELPEDGVPDTLPELDEDDSDDTDRPEEAAGGGGDLTGDADREEATTVTAVGQRRRQPTEVERIAQAVEGSAEPPLEWPRRAQEPVNEYGHIGLFTQAFPTLFPMASADISHVDPTCPRAKHVEYGEWLAHLMSLEDGRYARHPRFRYYVWNLLQRKRAAQTGRVFMRRDEEARGISAEELQQVLAGGNRSVEHQLHYFASSLRGTPQWKRARRSELLDLIEEVGMPTFFFTTSAADLHWPDLQLLMMQQEGTATDDSVVDDAGRNGRVVRNPHVAGAFFSRRLQLLLEHVVNSEGQLQHYWAIFEWQHRGSVHAHGLLWMDDCPVPRVEELLSAEGRDEEKRELLAYYDSYISAWYPGSISAEDIRRYQHEAPNHPQLANPTIVTPQASRHPCQVRYGESDDPVNDLAQLVNVTNRHRRCSTTTCLRKKRGQLVCKAGFPQELRAESAFVPGDREGAYKFAPARNDPIMNAFPRRWIELQRSNMDLKPVLSQHALVQYITKYCTKNEPSSNTLQAVTEQLLQRQARSDAEPASAASAYSRLLMSSVGSRDVTAQEVAHHSLQLPAHLTSATFAVATINQREVTAGGVVHNSPWQKYTNRPTTEPADAMSFIDYLRSHNLDTHRPRRRSAVPRIFPRLEVSGPEDPKFEAWCHHQLRVHRPCRSDTELRPSPSVSWAEALRLWVDNGGPVPDPVLRVLRGCQPQSEEAEEEEEEEDSEDGEDRAMDPDDTQEDWILAGRAEQLPAEEDADTPDQPDWHAYRHTVQELADDADTFIQRSKSQHEVHFVPPSHARPELLNEEQQKAFQLLHASIQPDANAVHLLISGTAGSGKSFLNMCLRRCCLDEFGEESARYLRVCAPTGTAAFNIMGETLHRTLSLPVPLAAELPELAGEQLQTLQARLEGLRLLVIDEMSMVGRKLLRAMDLRLRQAFPHHATEPFGGVSICMLGDFGQLPPVLDRPMFDTASGGGRLSEDGRATFRSFTKAVVLQRVERVRGDDPAQERFRRLLSNVRNGAITQDDYRLLSTRLDVRLGDREKRLFVNAPRLVASHDAEQTINSHQLRELGRPCYTLRASHNPAMARKTSAQDAGGLEPVVRLTEGAKVMLRSNLWVSAGLTNGTLGTVVGLLYPPDTAGPDSLPTAVCVEFDGYQGPAWIPQQPKVVPVPAITTKWMNGARLHSRTQVPLTLAFAVTIHKCQGWTRPAVWVDIGPKEFALGLTFVALSRATSLRGIILNPTDPATAQWSRLLRINNSEGQKKRRAVDQLLARLQAAST